MHFYLAPRGPGKPEPVVYWTLLRAQTIRKGKGWYSITETQSKESMKKTMENTRSINKVSVNAKVTASTTISAYSVNAEASIGYEGSFQDEEGAMSSTTQGVASTMTDRFEVPANAYGLAIVEMKMLVYQTKEGGDKLFSLSFPTGQMIVGSFDRESLKGAIIDSTFKTIARDLRVTYKSIKSIQKLATNVPTLEENDDVTSGSGEWMPTENVPYQIFNTVFKGERLGAHGCKPGSKRDWCKATCYYSKSNSDNHYWKFKRDGNGYTIENLYRSGYFVEASPNVKQSFWAYEQHGRKTDLQIFKVIPVRGYKYRVRIISNKGYIFQSMGRENCKFDSRVTYPCCETSSGADIWELRPKKLAWDV